MPSCKGSDLPRAIWLRASAAVRRAISSCVGLSPIDLNFPAPCDATGADTALHPDARTFASGRYANAHADIWYVGEFPSHHRLRILMRKGLFPGKQEAEAVQGV
ncbi:hypothetical protein Pden_1626 [Paracoccus denitrificans PD1222]|uniref:Uncharacterized protein n=1 Tax=Paracoccus denitrificans (strain Pd 1222) TaxID=318586 RepID=A1B2I0_PARDP|nr:hypothetical protein Pden_1626 [Paracoccus denitrificans PD1222]